MRRLLLRPSALRGLIVLLATLSLLGPAERTRGAESLPVGSQPEALPVPHFPDRMHAFIFLFVKLGNLKPHCDPLQYREPDDQARQRDAQIRRLVQRELGPELLQPGEPRFAFVEHLSRPVAEASQHRAPPIRRRDRALFTRTSAATAILWPTTVGIPIPLVCCSD